MKKFPYLVLTGFALTLAAKAQTTYQVPSYGKIPQSDLEITACDFEKDANAMVLFDKGEVSFDPQYEIIEERHVAVKIFNDKGIDEAKVRIPFYSQDNLEYISNFQAQTYNLVNGKTEIVKLDKKQVFTEKTDKNRSAMVFTFPNVKAGSVIEYKYSLMAKSVGDFPDWYFQTNIPTRYSEFDTDVPTGFYYQKMSWVTLPYAVNTESKKVITNIPSLDDEPFMTSREDNLQRLLFHLGGVNIPGYIPKEFSNSWKKVGEDFAQAEDFGSQINRRLSGEDEILKKAKAMASQDQKIDYIFREVKNTVKWNDENVSYTEVGTSSAWDKKIGNATEVNLILCHLLKKAGINALPMLVSTRSHGKIYPSYPNSYQFNRAVVYIPLDKDHFYVMDATNKYNVYNQIPYNLLNSFGLFMDKENEQYDVVFLHNDAPARHSVSILATIKPEGKMDGSAVINSFSYHRSKALEAYKTDGENKYIEKLRGSDNGLKISDLKLDNMEVDTLPLRQEFAFNMDLSGSDGNYIYFNPGLFTAMGDNPFLSDIRRSDIDFGSVNTYSVSGSYTLPVGYKTDVLPKNVSLMMPDKSIIFRRIVGEDDGRIVVRFQIEYNKAIYFKDDYPLVHEFYKKMKEMMNEQVVLKKA